MPNNYSTNFAEAAATEEIYLIFIVWCIYYAIYVPSKALLTLLNSLCLIFTHHTLLLLFIHSRFKRAIFTIFFIK